MKGVGLGTRTGWVGEGGLGARAAATARCLRHGVLIAAGPAGARPAPPVLAPPAGPRPPAQPTVVSAISACCRASASSPPRDSSRSSASRL